MLVGAITLDNIRRGPAQAGTFGYWVGEPFARHGYMREAILGVVHYAFRTLELTRIEAACLPENAASRGVLENCGLKCGLFVIYNFYESKSPSRRISGSVDRSVP